MSYSQPATKQDEWVIQTLTEWRTWGAIAKHNGFFVEVGSHDGLHHSNTRLLEEEYGWTGILIEGNKPLYEKSLVNRPGCKSVHAIVGKEEGRCDFVTGRGRSASFSGIQEYMPSDWLAEHKRHQSVWVRSNVEPLAAILDRHDCPKVIDYLSLDVEGAELTILEGLLQDGRYSARCMTVEFRYDQLYLEKLEELLFPEYKLDEVRAFDACFVKV